MDYKLLCWHRYRFYRVKKLQSLMESRLSIILIFRQDGTARKLQMKYIEGLRKNHLLKI